MSEPELTERQIRRREESRVKRRRVLEETAIKALLVAPDGRAFLNWLFSVTGLFSSEWSSDPYRAAFASGQENVGRILFNRFLEISPEGTINMLKENSSDRSQPSPGPDDNSGPYDDPGASGEDVDFE